MLNVILTQSIHRRINPSNPFLRKTGAASVFAKASYTAVSLFKDDHEPLAAPANADDTSRFHDLIQPLVKQFNSSLRLCFIQARARRRDARDQVQSTLEDLILPSVARVRSSVRFHRVLFATGAPVSLSHDTQNCAQ